MNNEATLVTRAIILGRIPEVTSNPSPMLCLVIKVAYCILIFAWALGVREACIALRALATEVRRLL